MIRCCDGCLYLSVQVYSLWFRLFAFELLCLFVVYCCLLFMFGLGYVSVGVFEFVADCCICCLCLVCFWLLFWIVLFAFYCGLLLV